MLNDVTNTPLAKGARHLDRADLSASNKITPKAAESRALDDNAGTADYKPMDERREGASARDAIDFRPEETSLHRLYESTRAKVETSRHERIEDLRQAVKNGTYEPNLITVAERLLSSGELGRRF